MITERKIFGKIEILEDGQIQLREDTIIERDGIELIRIYHRRALEPGMDTSNETDKRLKAIIGVIWTPEMIEEYKKNKPKPEQ